MIHPKHTPASTHTRTAPVPPLRAGTPTKGQASVHALAVPRIMQFSKFAPPALISHEHRAAAGLSIFWPIVQQRHVRRLQPILAQEARMHVARFANVVGLTHDEGLDAAWQVRIVHGAVEHEPVPHTIQCTLERVRTPR
jgi:hypothetical protein